MERNDPAAAAADDGIGIPPDMVEAEAPEGNEPEANGLDAAAKKEAEALREQIRAQQSMISTLQRDLGDTKKIASESGEAVKELLEHTRDAKTRGFEYAREQVKARMRQAVADADTAAFARAEAELEELERMKPASKPEKKPLDNIATSKNNAPTPEVDPAVTEWLNENSWAKSSKNFSIARGMEEDLLESKPHLSTAERLKEVTAEFKRRFPEKFENAARNNPPAAARPGPQGARMKPKEPTLADLDADAKAALAAIKRIDPNFKDETYLKGYKAREARQKDINRL